MLKSLRPALILVLAAIIPVIVLAGVAGLHLLEEQQAAMSALLRERAERTGGALSNQLETQIALLAILSESPRLDPPVELEAFQEVATRLRWKVPLWETLRVSGLEGEVLLSVPREETPAGRVVDLASHVETVATAQPVVGSVLKGPKGNYAFPVRVPVLRDGAVTSVLSVVIRPEALTALFYANDLPSSWVAWVVDSGGKLVAASAGDPEFVGGPASSFVRSPVGSLEYESATNLGEAMRVASVPVGVAGWQLHVGMPLEGFTAPARTALLLVVATALVILLLASIAWVLVRRELRARGEQQAALENWQRLDGLGKLTGGVAHDFNNLLMSFQSGVESLRRRRADERKVDQILDMMLEAVSRGKGMTQRLLAFSRQSAQGSETVDLKVLLDRLRPVLRQASRDDIDLTISSEGADFFVSVDPSILEIALINLVTNAREAMPHGGSIRIDLKKVPDASRISDRLSGEAVALSISDTGAGIGPADLGRVFDPFFTTKGSGWPGLGLSQVYGFARRSKGIVTASSVPGRGTVFTLYFPRVEPAGAHGETAGQGALPSKILIVEDDAAVADAARLMLDESAVGCIVATDGAEALKLLALTSGIELVLSDIMMPGMSGLDLAPRIKALYPHVSIVLMTGYSEALERGADVGVPVLSKPFTQEQLIACLRSAMAGAMGSNVLQLRRR